MSQMDEKEKTLDSTIYYPNCDLTIWLRSCRQEVTTPLKGETTQGQVPKWLNGSLIRNGPGGLHIYGKGENDQPDGKHIFDCPGLLQKFEFKNGDVFYRNKFVNTKSHQRNMKANRLVLGEFGTVAVPDPCQTIFHKLSAIFAHNLEDLVTDTANISLQPFGDEVYTIAETGFAHRIDVETLDTTQTVNLGTELAIIHHTSHPHICEDIQKVYNVGQKIDLCGGPRYVIAEMDTRKRPDPSDSTKSPWSDAKILASIPSRYLLNICYMHSFSMTPNYFIIIEQPLCIFFPEVPISLLFRPKPLISSLKFYPEEDTLFHVIPRNGDGADRITFRTPSFFFLHTINAYEKEDGNLVVDICCYKDPSMIDCMYVEALENAHSNPNYATMFRGRPYRFHLNLNEVDTKSQEFNPAVQDLIVDFGCETPRINYDYDGKKYKYFYAISSDTDLDHPGWLVKVDTVRKTLKKWGEPELNSYGSEPIFVPTPGGKAEDDGIVLSTLLYGGENPKGPNKTSVVIFDAKEWQLLSKVDFFPGQSIPKCLHGWYFPTKPSLDEDSTIHF